MIYYIPRHVEAMPMMEEEGLQAVIACVNQLQSFLALAAPNRACWAKPSALVLAASNLAARPCNLGCRCCNLVGEEGIQNRAG
mmetsp:Transcript_34878/g.81538  ORF Transcript_34878/g.81538 Transcript_34878/m.81538 type:complete len:83 (+) Transcript_34878:105-353(+)